MGPHIEMQTIAIQACPVQNRSPLLPRALSGPDVLAPAAAPALAVRPLSQTPFAVQPLSKMTCVAELFVLFSTAVVSMCAYSSFCARYAGSSSISSSLLPFLEAMADR